MSHPRRPSLRSCRAWNTAPSFLTQAAAPTAFPDPPSPQAHAPRGSPRCLAPRWGLAFLELPRNYKPQMGERVTEPLLAIRGAGKGLAGGSITSGGPGADPKLLCRESFLKPCWSGGPSPRDPTAPTQLVIYNTVLARHIPRLASGARFGSTEDLPVSPGH